MPFQPGVLKAVAGRGGKAAATDVLRTAGEPHAVRLAPDRKSLAADGRSLLFVTAEIVDARGVVVPDADHLIAFDVTGGSLAGLDNGREESAERYQASTRTAFHGMALAIVRSGTELGALKVTASAEGLHKGTATVRTTAARSVATTPATVFAPDYPAPPNYPYADASYLGRPDTLPAAMLDGDPATGWSNGFSKAATALLPAFNGARPQDWVSVDFVPPGPSIGWRSLSRWTRRTPCPRRPRSRSGTGAVCRSRGRPSSGPPPRTRRPPSPSTRYAAPSCGSP